jgi:glycosyltransferase involved in cell wall biosynthesis
LDLHKVIAYYVKGFYLILKYKKTNSINIIYCYASTSVENLLFLLWARLLRYKLVFDIVEDYSFFEDTLKGMSRFKVWTVKQLEFVTCRWSAAIVVISTHLKKKYSHLTQKNVILIPITAKQNYNANKNEFNNPLQVVYAGSFSYKDGVNDIIEGFNEFNRTYKNALLILTGKSDQQVECREKYKGYPNIIFKGYVPDEEYYDLLRNADLMCMCRTNSSYANAGFPFKLGEYLATGNPVISSKASDVENYLTSDDAYLIDPNSPQQICDALTEIVSNPEKAREIGLNGMKKCKEFFSPDINGKLLYDLLNKIAYE